MQSARILIVDDDPKIIALLRNCFEEEGATVFESADSNSALDINATADLDLITLDLHLGKDDGLALARAIRRTSQVPIIMVTGKDDVIDRIVGLELGADDYITKPFHLREVLARARSVLRRSRHRGQIEANQFRADAGGSSRVIRFDGMTVSPDRFELLDRDGERCDLTSGDFKLLNVFLENPKRALSRERLMDLLNGPEWTPLDRTIDNQVARLRKKIERDPSKPEVIKTVRSVGYMLACELEDVSDKSSSRRA